MNYFIKQIGRKDCGFTCLKILLSNIYKNKNYLFYPEFDKEKSLSLLEIIKIGEKEGIFLEGFRYSSKEKIFVEKKKKILAIFKYESKLHMVYIKKVTKHKCIVLDPEYGYIKYSKEEFLKLWTGEALLIKKIEKKKRKNQFKNKKNYKIYDVIMIFLTIILHLLFLFTMYFVKSSNDFLLPLLLFLIYLLFNFFIENLVIHKMKKFDNIIKEIINKKKDETYQAFADLEDYKNNNFIKVINVTNSIMLIFNSSFLLGINSYLNIFAILIIIIFKILLKLSFNNKEKKLKINISDMEFSLKKDKENKNLILNEINNNVYTLIRIKQIKRIINFAILFFISILLTGFQNQISVNFLLFHFFAFIFISDSFDKILDYVFDLKTNDYYYNLRKYYDINY